MVENEGKKAPSEEGERRTTRSERKKGASSRSGASRSASAAERQGVLAALEHGLSEALPGVDILDRDLELDAAVRADLVAVDPVGRLVLVLVVGEEVERAVFDTLDVLAFARSNRSLLVRHIASRRVDPGLEPRVVLVDPACDEQLADRLAPLAPAGIEVFGVRTLRSAAGERSYLVRANDDPGAAGEAGVQAFLDALPLPLREIGAELADRMSRLDDELFATGDAQALVWRWNGEVLARLEASGDRLTASVGPGHDPSPVRGAADVEGVLEEALAHLVADFEGRRHASVPAHLEDRSVPNTPAADLLPDGPLLTDEEIQAFQD